MRDYIDIETMRCTGSPACNVTRCYHYDDHERYPDRLNPHVDYCVGGCFHGGNCEPVEKPERDKFLEDFESSLKALEEAK